MNVTEWTPAELTTRMSARDAGFFSPRRPERSMATLSFTVLGIVVLLGLLLLSAFFSSSETAIFTLPEQWLVEQEDSGDRRLATLRGLRGNRQHHDRAVDRSPPGRQRRLPRDGPVQFRPPRVRCNRPEVVRSRERPAVVARPIRLVERALYPLVVFFDWITRSLNGYLGGESTIERPYVDDEAA